LPSPGEGGEKKKKGNGLGAGAGGRKNLHQPARGEEGRGGSLPQWKKKASGLFGNDKRGGKKRGGQSSIGSWDGRRWLTNTRAQKEKRKRTQRCVRQKKGKGTKRRQRRESGKKERKRDEIPFRCDAGRGGENRSSALPGGPPGKKKKSRCP